MKRKGAGLPFRFDLVLDPDLFHRKEKKSASLTSQIIIVMICFGRGDKVEEIGG
jgi:hypothetical protein